MGDIEVIPGQEPAPGTLLLAATPIGRPDDASARLVAALASAPVIAAEDTRRLRRLADRLGVTPAGTIVSYYEGVEDQRAPRLLADLHAGRDVLLVTDAGMPGVSDPGFRLTAAAVAEGIGVTVLPGPSAVTAALAVSGLPSDRFCFEGFPPRRPGERARRFAELAGERRTMVFFESPKRTGATLGELATALGGDRLAVVCRELTKTHEEIRRGPLAELAEWAAGELLGEVTVVVAGAPDREIGPADVNEAVAEVARRVADGTSRRDAVAAVAAEAGLPRRLVYEAAVSPPASS
ncbi:MAG TPA: 16S rRNA (cytidine(1402)-2'-O)-methyltransferase [Streptosporangiaceae bacterium]|nr:16S rRNA (cytidine(1402)-2'-O)-methyltransferase [Streptosporangiaceae bacterium]